MVNIEKHKIRWDTPQVGVTPYRQVHAHSTGNKRSTVDNEADYHLRRPIESGFFTHVVGNGRVLQTAQTNRGSYDVGGGWNAESYASVELIESHSTKEEFMEDYKLYVELLRELAVEGGIPVTLDTDDLAGIKTHYYCTYHQPNNNSDHVDPYPYLESWGISKEQFKKDIEQGFNREEGWKKNETGWWYEYTDGTYPKEQFKEINGVWYYFDNSGYMLSNQWKKHTDGYWYWFKNSGEMVTGWQTIGDKKYYFKETGEMKTGWLKEDDKWYYLDSVNGDLVTNSFVKGRDGSYYVGDDGVMVTSGTFTVDSDGKIKFQKGETK